MRLRSTNHAASKYAASGAILLVFFGQVVADARDWFTGIESAITEEVCVPRLGCSEVDRMVWRTYLPAGYDPSQKYPLVLFLHGSGESGLDNDDQVRVHIGPLINHTESDYPAILVAPQLPQSTGWSPYNAIDRTTEILERTLAEYSVDTNRLYITGLSMGGFGTMEYLDYYHTQNPGTLKFAAAAPLSGAFAPPDAHAALGDVPIWLAHGDADNTVSVQASRGTFRALADLAPTDPIPFDTMSLLGKTAEIGNVRYTELPRQGHVIWSPIYNQDEFYDWMFSKSLAPPVPEPSGTFLSLIAAGILGLARGRRGGN